MEEPAAMATTSGGANYSDQVMSEVHLGCPPGDFGPHLSHFTFFIPPHHEDEASPGCNAVMGDDDGDLIVSRRSRVSGEFRGVIIQHSIMSSIPKVGLQIWRAELVLADFVLHKMFSSSEFDGIIAIELGSGTGLVGILIARAAKLVFITDHGDDILANCAKNVQLNMDSVGKHSSVNVRELDWQKSWPPADKKCDNRSRYSWTSSEIEDVHRASVLLAADVIYSNDLTDALFNTVEKLMSQGSQKVLYLALEKRYNVTLDYLGVVANGYSHFHGYLRDDGELISSSRITFSFLVE